MRQLEKENLLKAEIFGACRQGKIKKHDINDRCRQK
jgi:hypothetical protein